MQPNQKMTLAAIAAGLVGYKIGSLSWQKRRAREAVENLVMLSKLYVEISDWLSSEALTLNYKELEDALQEKLLFVAIAAKATDR